MKRQKYKAKNIHAYKILRECSHPYCDEIGFVTYWDDPNGEHRKVEHRCIDHVHWVKETTAIDEAKRPESKYVTMTDHRKWMSLAIYQTKAR